MRQYELPKSVVAAIKHYSHRQNVDRGTRGEAKARGRTRIRARANLRVEVGGVKNAF